MFGFIKKLFGHKPERPPTSQESQALGPEQPQNSADRAPQAILAPREDRVFPRKLPAREFDAFVNLMRDIVSGKIPSDPARYERAKELLRGLSTVKKFLYSTYKMECEIYNAPAYVEHLDPALSFISGVACPFRILDLGIVSIHAPVLDYDRPNFWVNWSLDPLDYNSKFPHILFTFGRKEGEQFPDLRNCSCNSLFISEPKPEPPFYETIMESHKVNTHLLNVQIYREQKRTQAQGRQPAETTTPLTPKFSIAEQLERNSLANLTKDIASNTPNNAQSMVIEQAQAKPQDKADAEIVSKILQANQRKTTPVFKNQNVLSQQRQRLYQTPKDDKQSKASSSGDVRKDHSLESDTSGTSSSHNPHNSLDNSFSGHGGSFGYGIGRGGGDGVNGQPDATPPIRNLNYCLDSHNNDDKEQIKPQSLAPLESKVDAEGRERGAGQSDQAQTTQSQTKQTQTVQEAKDAPASTQPISKPSITSQQYALLVEKRDMLRQAAARLEAAFGLKPKHSATESEEVSQQQTEGTDADPKLAQLKKLLDVPERDFGPAIPYDLTGFGDDANQSEVSSKYMSEMFGSNSLVPKPKKLPLATNLSLHAGISQTVASKGIETDSSAGSAVSSAGLAADKATTKDQFDAAFTPSSTGESRLAGEHKDFAFDAGPESQVSQTTRPEIKSLDVEDISEMARIDDDNVSTALLPLIQIQELRLLVEKIFNITDRYSTLQAAGCTGYLLTSKLNAYLDPVARQNKRKWVECGSPKLAKESLAFEACHLAGILTMGADLGYLDTTEVLMIFQDIRDLLLENFSSWEEYGDAIVQQLNRCNKDQDSFKEVLFAIEQLKTNYYSPWNEMVNPWPLFGL